MASWVRTITTPFRKARTLFNPQPRDNKKSQQEGQDENNRIADLHGEVMACGYEDVQKNIKNSRLQFTAHKSTVGIHGFRLQRGEAAKSRREGSTAARRSLGL
nr:hypothetical protein DM860_001720 [Ipomoea batatas]